MNDYKIEGYIYNKKINKDVDINEYFKTDEDLKKWACAKEKQIIEDLHNVKVTIQ